jgi:hypothetical protein
MNRLLILKYRRNVSADAPFDLKWKLYSVYYYYDGGTLEREFIGIPAGQDPTADQLAEYPTLPASGTYLTEAVCVNNRVRRFKIRVFFGDQMPAEIEDTNENCGVACDLLIDSLSKEDATPGEADGTIAVVASTSNPVIEYRLRSVTTSFIVADWQLSPVFSGLTFGLYQVYARDSKGCFQDKLIYVAEAAPVYGERYRSSYVDRRGRNTVISIFQRGYEGAVIERLSLKGALSIEYDGNVRNKYQAVFGSSATINLYAESRLDFVDLYSSDDRRNRVEVYKDDTVFWKGWLIADYYEDPYVRASSYGITLRAVDGLGDLQQSFYQTVEKFPFEGLETQMTIVRRCLEKTGLSLPMRTGINVYESRVSTGDEDDPLVQTYVDNRAYHLHDDDDPLSHFEVLERNLMPYGARIFQSQGNWWILNVNEMLHDVRIRNYTEEGVFDSATVYSPVRAIHPPTYTGSLPLYWFHAQQHREVLPGCKLYTLLQDYGLRDNFCPDGEFYNEDFADSTHLKKWTWDARIRQAGTPNPTGYDGKLDYIPPRAFSGEVIKRKVAEKDPYGLIIEGTYMQVDSFGRVLLFRVKFDIGPLDLFFKVWYNIQTQKVETQTVQPAQLVPAESEDDYVPHTDDVGDIAEYRTCEGGFVNWFKRTSTLPFAVKELAPGPTACPVTYGQPAFVRSQHIAIEQLAGQGLKVSFTFRINATERRYGANAKSEIAKFFQGRIELRIGNYAYDGQEERWTLFTNETEAKQIYFSAGKINEEETFELVIAPFPVSGDLYAEIGNLLYDGTKGYFENSSVSLYIRDFKLQLIKYGDPYPDSFLLSSLIDRRYTYVPDQEVIYHGDLPPGERNMPLAYAGGMYLNLVEPAQLTFSRTMPGTSAGYTNDYTVLRGSGTGAILGRFKLNSEVYLVRSGNTVDDREGPYLVKGFVSATNDVILKRVFPIGEVILPVVGYVFLAEELEGKMVPTVSWKRVGPTALENEPEQLLLRIALQNRALAHSQPSIKLGGKLKGDLGFEHAITDPHMADKVFVPAFFSYNDNEATVSGEWVEMGTGQAGDIITNPPPGTLAGNRTWEDGQLQYYENLVAKSTEENGLTA